MINNNNNNNIERTTHMKKIYSLFSSWWSRLFVAVLGLIIIGLMIEIVFLIKFEHGFVLNDVMMEKAYRIFRDDSFNQVDLIEFKRKTVVISHKDNMKSEILNMKRSITTDQLFIVKLVERMNRNSTLTTHYNFEKTYLLKSGNIYLIRADQYMLKEMENEIVWIRSFENELKTSIDMFYIYEQAKNSTRDSRIALELLLIPSLTDINSLLKVTERFQTNFNAFMKYHSDNYQIEIVGDGMIDIQVPFKFLDRIAEFLLDNPSVKWIQRREPMRTSNKVATKHAQGLRTDGELNTNSNPIWERNITGEGEVITVADTGLDWDSCFFSDPSLPVTTGQVNKDHRKVLAYINMSNNGKQADGKDSLDGHGTLCNSYGKRDMQIDDFLYENQDAVVVFAAGNEGNIAVDGTIATTSKNAIVVGASMTSNQGFVDSIQYLNLDEESEICGVTSDTCCSDYSCSFSCCPSRMESQLKVLKTSYNQNNVAFFSARGPATGNRMKPDCKFIEIYQLTQKGVAVGDRVVSTRSDGSLSTNQCGNIYPNATNDAALKVSTGTSMSTPINKNRIKKVRRFEESEIYDDIIRAEDDEFVDDIPVDENEFKDDDQDVEYENCIEYQGGHKETYTPHRGDKSSGSSHAAPTPVPPPDSKQPDSSTQQAQQEQPSQQLSFNPYSYYKSLLDNDLNYVKFYGDKVNTHGEDSQYPQIAKKYANNLANHAKYLYKYRTFAPSTYRKYILQVYEYSKRVVEVAKVQNWNGYMYYLSITIEYYRKIDVLEQTGYAGTNYVQTTPVATYYGAGGTPTAYYSNGAPPAGAVTATAVAPVNPSYYPANYPSNYGGYGYGAAPANYYNGYGAYGGYPAAPAATGYGAYGGYPAATTYGYGGYPSSYYPAQYRQPVQQVAVAKGADVSSQQPAQASSASQASSNSTNASSGSSSSSSTPTPSSNSNNAAGASSSNSNPSPQKKKLNPIEQLEKLNSQVSSHVGEFNDDASNPTTEPFSFEYLM
ncbi:predicted protein [Naegleria gruberi]|uniref:Predicted protein n=1 Tax=Naegleria gruberi TaxID=5762 RepID=D2W1G9_NAEGR|nr:uncharacterized protein NAEGRDRAFT_53966 [Naegleria gruberi]EFC37087.1 predicted protein [Naegleria gruberi]|eukprot:XP_002669831.1 predicted protein [Naegleria gruberi strain NEG-M]